MLQLLKQLNSIFITFVSGISRCSFADIPDNEFTVRGLTEGKEYEFRVAAVNNAGVGDFSDATERIKAQPPPGNPAMSHTTD